MLAPLALLVAYEAGYALFRRVGPAVAVVCAQVGVTALAPAHGGAYTALGLPATASRQLLVPAAIALALAYVERPTRQVLASVAAAGLVLAVVHPTYAIFLWLPFAGFLVVRSLVAREESKRIAVALAALVLPAAAFLAWLLPVVRDTASHAPGKNEVQRAFVQYAGQLDVFSDTSYRLAPEVFGRAGAIAVVALLFVPLAGLALRRRWAAYVLGGFLAVAAVMLVAPLFVVFSDLVSISQSRRAAGFWPLSFAFAGGFAVLAALMRGLVLPLALAGGIALQLAYPGEFDYALREGGPALVTWIAVFGGLLALAIGLWRRPAVELPGTVVGLAAALFVLPVAVHAAANWSPSPARTASPLTPGLVQALREDVPEGAVVYSDLETSYRIAAEAPVYIAAAPPGHVADTEENRPYERRAENIRFFRTGDAAIPRQAGAGWLVLDRGASTSFRSSTRCTGTAATRSTSSRSRRRLASRSAAGRPRRDRATRTPPAPCRSRGSAPALLPRRRAAPDGAIRRRWVRSERRHGSSTRSSRTTPSPPRCSAASARSETKRVPLDAQWVGELERLRRVESVFDIVTCTPDGPSASGQAPWPPPIVS